MTTHNESRKPNPSSSPNQQQPRKRRTPTQNLHTLGYPPHYDGTDTPTFNTSGKFTDSSTRDISPTTRQHVKPLPRAEVEAAFQFFDIHNKKRLTPSDLKQRLAAFYPHLSNKEYKFLVSEPDFTVDTLTNILNHHTLRDFDPVKEAFKVFDPHDTGYIDKSMLKKILKNLGYGNITSEDMKVLIQTADVDGDGRISYEDWKNMTGFDMEKGPVRSQENDDEDNRDDDDEEYDDDHQDDEPGDQELDQEEENEED